MAHLEADRAQAGRLLALEDAAAAAVAQRLVDRVVVEVVGGVVGVDPADGLALDGVARADLLGGQPVGSHRARDLEVGRADVAAPAALELVDRPDRGQGEHALGGAALAHLHAHRPEPRVDAPLGVDGPGVRRVRLHPEKAGHAPQAGQGGPAGGVAQDLPPGVLLAHAVASRFRLEDADREGRGVGHVDPAAGVHREVHVLRGRVEHVVGHHREQPPLRVVDLDPRPRLLADDHPPRRRRGSGWSGCSTRGSPRGPGRRSGRSGRAASRPGSSARPGACPGWRRGRRPSPSTAKSTTPLGMWKPPLRCWSPMLLRKAPSAVVAPDPAGGGVGEEHVPAAEADGGHQAEPSGIAPGRRRACPRASKTSTCSRSPTHTRPSPSTATHSPGCSVAHCRTRAPSASKTLTAESPTA